MSILFALKPSHGQDEENEETMVYPPDVTSAEPGVQPCKPLKPLFRRPQPADGVAPRSPSKLSSTGSAALARCALQEFGDASPVKPSDRAHDRRESRRKESATASKTATDPLLALPSHDDQLLEAPYSGGAVDGRRSESGPAGE